MNHLAHTLLAGDDEFLRLGGLMGDFVHGTPDAALPARVIAGIRLHRAIDVYTDSHPVVVEARALLPVPYRRYGGILLDMWFDHLLARDFPRWSDHPLDAYSAGVRELLYRHESLLPPGLLRFRHYMEAHALPAGYARPEEMGAAFDGISHRLRRANPVAEALPVLVGLDRPLQAAFEAFFPQLRQFAAQWIEAN
ncbi:Acyl carrier protein phosphodiesterase [Dyella jiangningensis]|uniref:acyl carrier protein phosphodiesterase n=1 Tax=Dyella sp. AtDHG13 TaxID=1938897 RepID=UPI00088616C1|nr:ACP phosphodiesterase [Dyella sp. AtDHG13]PXV55314.1 acyl carrier protein phosphodiesterase [Dyella sp. AtDHG13]SDK81237.1 Acyl carrier protein phosphodiesterase [Dyella jiangningensis]